MRELRLWACLILTVLLGCSTAQVTAERGVIVFVPGVAGDGPWYDGLRNGLREGGIALPIQTFRWGAPAPLFALNFNTKSIHDDAERRLVERFTELAAANGDAPIIVLAHSAGCGVALGGASRLPTGVRIRNIVLLNPSVSPKYDLSPALQRADGVIVFHSDRDTTFLKWRTSTFGTYDGVKTVAAGNAGFDLSLVPPEQAARVRQFGYQPAYAEHGNRGDHFGATARRFARIVIAPLVQATAVEGELPGEQ